MELDERKLKILQAIIRTYLETGEPVGSRTISKYSDLNLSSATIRNEMSDLEEMGYILQPHTSAGRIPSDKGYRLYVDTMLDDKAQEVHDMKAELQRRPVRSMIFSSGLRSFWRSIRITPRWFRDRGTPPRRSSSFSLRWWMREAFLS